MGGVLSTTLTVKVHVRVLLDASVAVRVTVIDPGPSVVPAAGDCVRIIDADEVQLSLTVARFL